jgi:amino acid permease
MDLLERDNDRIRSGEQLPLVAPAGAKQQSSSGPAVHLYGWQHASLIITGEVLGTGILALPHAMVSLGWVYGLGSCVIFALSAVYSGLLLARVQAMYPGAGGYASMAHRLGGWRFGCFTNCAILFNWSFLLPYYLMASANGLVIAFYDIDACYWQWAVLVMIVLLPLLQIRTLHGLRFLALVSDVVVMVCLAMILFSLFWNAPTSPPNPLPAISGAGHSGAEGDNLTSFWPPPTDGGVLARYGSMASFVFAYQGQSMFFEIMKEMERPASFPKAIYAGERKLVHRRS